MLSGHLCKWWCRVVGGQGRNGGTTTSAATLTTRRYMQTTFDSSIVRVCMCLCRPPSLCQLVTVVYTLDRVIRLFSLRVSLFNCCGLVNEDAVTVAHGHSDSPSEGFSCTDSETSEWEIFEGWNNCRKQRRDDRSGGAREFHMVIARGHIKECCPLWAGIKGTSKLKSGSQH